MIVFQHPWMLTALAAVPLFYFIFRRRKQPSVVIPTTAPLKKLRGKRKLSIMEYTILASLALLAVALARPRKPLEGEKIRAKGLDIVLALDMSGSMRALDKPAKMSDKDFVSAIQNGTFPDRLQSAKQEIRRFIEKRPNDRIGLIGFADMAYSFVPPTLDHALLLDRLASLTPGEIGEQTGIASPIGVGVERLRRSDAPRRVMVLFTDGANTAANRLTPQQAAELARDYQVILHTVGIGSNNAYMIQNTFGGARLIQVPGSFDVALMKELAKITGGNYFHAADSDGLRETMEQINSLEKTDITSPRYTEYREFAPYLALIAVLFIFFGIIAENSWQLRLP